MYVRTYVPTYVRWPHTIQGPFDLVCVDVNLLPREATSLIADHVLTYLRPGALLILTLKVPTYLPTYIPTYIHTYIPYVQ